MKRLLTIAIATLIANAANAQFVDGNDLVKDMREMEKHEASAPDVNYNRASEFRGFVLGVHDTLDVARVICSRNVTKRQIGLIVAKYMNANPELWAQSAAELVSNALKSAIPCKK